MAVNNVITVNHEAKSFSTTRSLHQYDYGQILKLEGFCLSAPYEVHFSNDQANGKSYTVVGDENGVAVPDVCLKSGRDIWAWLYAHTGADDGESVYTIHIPVVRRSIPTGDAIPQEERDILSDAIAKVTSVTDKLVDLQTLATMLESGNLVLDDGEAFDIDLDEDLDLEVDDGL